MIKDVKEDGYGGFEGFADSKRWGEMTLCADTRDKLDHAERCLEYLDALPADVEGRFRKYLVRFYKAYVEELGEEEFEDLGDITEENVLQHINLNTIVVDDNTRTDRVEFHVGGGCDWEPEHGLELTISDGKILYVGTYEDYAPNSSRLKYAIEHYGFYDPDDDCLQMNYADKE